MILLKKLMQKIDRKKIKSINFFISDDKEHKLEEKLFIDNQFIVYEKRLNKRKNIWWSIKVFYTSKKCYLFINNIYTESINTNKLSCYFVNHTLNIQNKKLSYGRKPYKFKIRI